MSEKDTFINRICCDLENPIETNWIVITGAPSSGKTTLVRYLSNIGFDICDDVAREVIQDTMNNSRVIDEQEKQLLIVEKLLQRYDTIPEDKFVFLDYGMPDNLVFQAQAGFKLEIAERAAKLIRYRAVFLLEPLAIEYDGIRNLDYATQHSLHNDILKKYVEFGYSPILVPPMNIQLRLNKVLNYIKEAICHF